MEAKAYWYKHEKLFDIGLKKHVHFIIDYPEIFSFTQPCILDAYAFHHEKLYSEGKAREDLIKKVTEYGWIRIRHYVKPHDYWSIQCYNITKQSHDLFSVVSALMHLTHDISPGDELVFSGFQNQRRVAYTYMQGGVAAYFTENKDRQAHAVHLISDFKEMRPL